MWTRAELKDNAKKFFKFNYWKMVLVALVLSMIGGGGGNVSYSTSYSTTQRTLYSNGGSTMTTPEMLSFLTFFFTAFAVIMVFALALGLLLYNPLYVGAQRFFVVSHYQKAELGELGHAFSNAYINVVKTMFLRGLFTFLWSLLFVIPGIIKGYEYRMIPYILAENPGIDFRDAFAASKKMMDGNKWNAFVLDLSFLGWIFLSLFTCGILAIFYVNPYIHMTNAELYVALKEITFGSQGQYYQYGQMYQSNQSYQNDQAYWNNQNGQSNQTYQGGQSYQSAQTYQDGQSYQSAQTYQSNQTYQDSQSYQSAQTYQDSQGYQNGQTTQDNLNDTDTQS
ncbi:MAG: DUF975 family protein [Lachnospiraceae bacterium]|nr:DUF975 family protein [Lachnospiraceae bacterium]